MTTLNTAEQMNTLLGKITRASQSLRSRTQDYLIHAAGHAYQHGDVSYFAKLVKAAKGADAKRITAWAVEYGFTQINAKDGSAKLVKAARKAADFADGAAVVEHLTTEADNWWEIGIKAKAPAVLDVNKKVQSIIKALTEALDEDTPALVNVEELREEMQSLIHYSQLMEDLCRQLKAEAAAANVVAIAA
jgi:hypothetical protein